MATIETISLPMKTSKKKSIKIKNDLSGFSSLRLLLPLAQLTGVILGSVSCSQFNYSNQFSKLPDVASIQFVQPVTGMFGGAGYTSVSSLSMDQLPLGATTTRTVYLLNAGQLAASELSLSLDNGSVASGVYVLSHQCGSSLQPPPNNPQGLTLEALSSSLCQVNLAFSPNILNKISGNLNLSYSNGRNKTVTASLPLSGISMPWAYLKLIPPQSPVVASKGYPQGFPVQVWYNATLLPLDQQGQIPSATLSGLSLNAVSLSFLSANLIAPFQSAFQPSALSSVFSVDSQNSNNCSTTIRANCNLYFKFNPDFGTVLGSNSTTAVAQADFVNNLQLGYNNGYSGGNLAKTVVLGHGLNSVITSPYTITSKMTPSAIAYQPVTPAIIQVDVVNGGASVPGENLQITLPSNSAYSLITNDSSHQTTCVNNQPMPSSVGCTIFLNFNPSEYKTYSDHLTVRYNFSSFGVNSMTLLEAPLSYTGAKPANLVISSDLGGLNSVNSLDLGSVSAFDTARREGSSKSFYLVNTGDVSARGITFPTPSLLPNFSVTNTCGLSSGGALAAGASCQFNVNFTAPIPLNSYSSSLVYAYNSGSTSTGSNGAATASSLSLKATSVSTPAIAVSFSSLLYPMPMMFGRDTHQTANATITVYGTQGATFTLSGATSCSTAVTFSPISGLGNCVTSGSNFTVGSNQTAATTCTQAFQASLTSGGGTALGTTCGGTLTAASTNPPAVGSATINVGVGNPPVLMVTSASGAAVNYPSTIPFTPSSNSITSVGQTGRLGFNLTNSSNLFPVLNLSLGLFAGSSDEFSISSSQTPSLGTGGSTAVALSYKPSLTATPVPSPVNGGWTSMGSVIAVYNNGIVDVKPSPQPISAKGSSVVSVSLPNGNTVDFGTLIAGTVSTPQTVKVNVYGSSSTPWLDMTGLQNLLQNIPGVALDPSSTCLRMVAGGSTTSCTLVFQFTASLSSSLNGGNLGSLTLSCASGSGVTCTSPLPTINFKAVVNYASARLATTPASMPTPKAIFQDPDSSNPYTSSVLGTTKMNSNLFSSTAQVITVMNTSSTGGLTATLSSINMGVTPNPSFKILDPKTSDACKAAVSLAPGSSCKITVQFTPQGYGLNQDTLTVGWTNPTGINNNPTPQPLTISLSGIGTAPLQVFAGGDTTCVVNEIQGVTCWGDNSNGQLGQGNQSVQSSSVTVPGFGWTGGTGASGTTGVYVTRLAVGDTHVCALFNSPSKNVVGAVTCWGNNEYGQLGLGLSAQVYAAPQVKNGAFSTVNLGEPATSIVAGSYHTCAILSSGSVACWGQNTEGQLGNGTTQNVGSNPAGVSGLKGALQISAGVSHSCAILAGTPNSVQCWGNNYYGQLGQGSQSVRILGLPESAISLGSNNPMSVGTGSQGAFTCVLSGDSKVKCFGQTDSNRYFWGVLGRCVSHVSDASHALISCGTSGYPSVVDSSTDVYGTYSTDMGSVLPSVFSSRPASQLSVGGFHSCVIFSDNDGGVGCWGMNDHGQLGNGVTANIGALTSDFSAFVNSITSTVGYVPLQLDTGHSHSCVVLSDNTVKCWGSGAIANANGHNKDTGSVVADDTSAVYDGSR